MNMARNNSPTQPSRHYGRRTEVPKTSLREKPQSTIDTLAASKPGDSSTRCPPPCDPDGEETESHEPLPGVSDPSLEAQEPRPDEQDLTHDSQEPGYDSSGTLRSPQVSLDPRQSIKAARALLNINKDQAKAYDEQIIQWFRANPTKAL